MKKVFFVLLAAVFSYSAMAQNEDPEGHILKNGQKMPVFQVTTMDGDILKSSELKGKVVLINFFATWCPPCRKELPHVQKEIWEKYKDNEDFVLLIISREEKPAKVKPFIAEKKYPMPFYSDIDRSCYKQFAAKFIPRNYLFDASGKLVYFSKGFVDEEFQEMLGMIEKLVN